MAAHVTQKERAAQDGYRRIRWYQIRPGDEFRSCRNSLVRGVVMAVSVRAGRAYIDSVDDDGCERFIDARARGRCDLRV